MAYSHNLTPKPNFEIPEGGKKTKAIGDKLNRLHTKHIFSQMQAMPEVRARKNEGYAIKEVLKQQKTQVRR